MAAVGIRLSPGYEKTQNMRKLKTAEEAARRSTEVANSTSQSLNNEELAEALEIRKQGASRLVDIKQQQFELDPTAKRYQDLLQQRVGLKALRAESELNARQTEVRGSQPTITQQLREDDPGVRSTRVNLVESFRQRMRGETNGNNK